MKSKSSTRDSTSKNNNSQVEQKISCPICKKKIPFFKINIHLDTCIDGSKAEAKKQPSVTSMFGKKRSQQDQQAEIIDLSDSNTNNDEKSSPITKKVKLNDFSSPIVKKEASDHFTTFVRSTEDYELRYLEKIKHLPLSEKLRPHKLSDYIGQQHLLSPENGTLNKFIMQGQIPNMVLWGPPGVGKTSLARLMVKTANESCEMTKYQLIEISATGTNSQELRGIFDKGKREMKLTKRQIVLFIDEIHRFNKIQQDLLLPHVENGDIVLIGATTENPSFQLNNALISRCNVFILEKLLTNEIIILLSKGMAILNKYRRKVWKIDKPLILKREVMEYISDLSVGDARRAINLLEMIEISTRIKHQQESKKEIDENEDKENDADEGLGIEEARNILKSNSKEGLRTYYDTKGDNHYDTISAFHKAIRGSDENASMYYLGRMLQGGEDPLYIARRMIRIASEDVGIRDNTLLPLAIAAHDAVMKVGLPEADMALVHCCVALARAPKSVEIYRGWKQLKELLKENKYNMANGEIPMYIRNAPTKLMKEIGYHKGYKYNPNYKDGKVKQEYFPEEVLQRCEDPEELKFLNHQHLGHMIDPDLYNDEVIKEEVKKSIIREGDDDNEA